MARNSKGKKKKPQGVKPLDPQKVIEKLKEGGTNFPPQIVRPGRCGGCDVVMRRM